MASKREIYAERKQALDATSGVWYYDSDLALGLSYPNIEDAQRGLSTGLITQEQYQAIVDANKAGVTPPWDTPLGGAIEIHGNQGDRGTAGCIAMTNDVMDILWSYCAVGVPVTIGP